MCWRHYYAQWGKTPSFVNLNSSESQYKKTQKSLFMFSTLLISLLKIYFPENCTIDDRGRMFDCYNMCNLVLLCMPTHILGLSRPYTFSLIFLADAQLSRFRSIANIVRPWGISLLVQRIAFVFLLSPPHFYLMSERPLQLQLLRQHGPWRS